MFSRYPWQKSLSDEPCCPPSEFINCKDLSLSYGDQVAFKNINFTISKNCVQGIVGPSGCGKSSFLLSLNRMTELIPEAKLNGEINFKGQNILKVKNNLKEIRKKIGLILQEPTPFPTSIENNILLPLKEHKIPHRKEKMIEVLKQVGLWEEVKDRLQDSALNLSGGQKQRLCIARTLTVEPEVLLMDEPCSALDPMAISKFEEMVENLRKNYTIVIVTHNLAQARRLCDKVALFWNEGAGGELIEQGSTQKFFENPTHQLTKDYVGGVTG